LELAHGDSNVSVVVPKGKNTRSNRHLPMETPKVESENIIKNRKSCQEGFSDVVPGTSGNLHDSTIKTLVFISNSPLLPSAEVYRSLDFEFFPVEYSSFNPKLK